MAELKENQNKGRKVNNASAAMPLSDIFFMTIRHWPWILLSVILCVGSAYIYLLRTPNVYTRAAEILIKDDSKGQSFGMDEFANMGLFQLSSNIQNEMTNLKSKDLMEEVVKRLGLDINYYKDGRFHDVIVYGYDLPVKVSIAGFPDDGSVSFNLNVSKEGKVLLDNVEHPDYENLKDEYSGALNDSIATPFGKVIVSTTPNYRPGESISLKVEKYPLSAARDSYNARLSISMANETGSVVKLSMADQSIQRADEVLNTLIGVYNENWIRDRNQIAVSTSNFINDRLGVIESELGNVDSDISSYKSANLVPNVEAASSMYMNQSQQTQAQILELNNQLQMTRYIRSYLTAEGNRDQLLPANTGVNSGNIQSLIGSYNEKLLQRNSLIAKSSEKNPLVKQLDEQLMSQRQAIINTIDNEIISLNTQIKALKGSEAQTISRIASNPSQAKYLLSVERQQKVKESLYLFLLQKREENELSQAFTAYNTRVVNRPGASGIPPTPNRRNILAIAFIIGLAIPFGFTYFKETSNTKIRGRKDVEGLTLPFLGEIPLNGDSKKKDEDNLHELVVKEGCRDVINESFRVLRTNVEFMNVSNQDGANVIAVTSFNPHSGKSFIAMNLGKTLSLKGRKVLVIDGDMRHGTASEYVGSPNKGLADFLNGSISDINSVIVNESGSLDVLPIGTVPPNPTELLETPVFKELVSQLRGEYDIILIDCPPIEVVADAQIIDKQVDRTVFVVRAGLLERTMLPELEKLYEQKKYKNMSFILNGTTSNQGRYGYSHGYRYGYGYGYSYGYNYGTDGKKGKKE